MFKKFTAVILCFAICFTLAACGGKAPVEEPQNEVQADPIPEAPQYSVNPLTGELNLDPTKENYRPVTVMIDNDSVAQNNAQSGVPYADIVFETEVEGGITRLMAVFADISKAPQIGDVRSARAVFVDIAKGFNAIYTHHGRDEVYCGPRMRELGTDNFVIGENNCGWRKTYGNSTNWQNLYTTGEKLAESLKANSWKLTQDKTKVWQSFSDTAPALTGGTAAKATVAFSGTATSYFTYNAESGKYIKTSRQSQNKNLTDNADYAFKNVFILKTTMSHYSDNYHRKVDLNSGSGYYLVNGNYEKIKWSKGAASNNFTFTKEDGSPLTVAAGNSWVCIAKTDAGVSFE